MSSTVKQQGTFSQKVGARDYEVLSPCVCRVLKQRVEQYNLTAVPGVLAHASFENYRPYSQAQDHARQLTTRFTSDYRKGQGSRGFVISGPVGTGKTHLLAAALAHLALEVGEATRYVEISLLYATIRRGFQENKSGGEIIGPLSEVDVLAIDELGKGRGSAFELETLEELIARRYNAGKTTLFATNYSLEPHPHGTKPAGWRSTEDVKAAANRDPELLRERVGERIYSRLCEMCEFMELPQDSRDYRQEKHEQLAAAPRQRPRGR